LTVRSVTSTHNATAALDGARIPLHRRISDELRRAITIGELRPGDLLPSENALMLQHGVSRGTVRQALAALRAERLIAGSRGRPMAVQVGHLTQPLSELISFSAWILALGMVPSGKVVEFGLRAADQHSVSMLGVAPGSPVYHLVRVRMANDKPLMIERTIFVQRIGERVAEMDLQHQSIYEELARAGVLPVSARHSLSAVSANSLDARLLEVPERTALLRIRRQAFSSAGEALEWSDDRYRADRVDFAIENSVSGPGVVRRLA
jgi:GntR family transcriptional regulator